MPTRRQVLAGAAALPILLAARGLARLAAPVAVDWMWSGATSETGATVVAKFDAALTSCRLKVSTASDLSASPIFGEAVADDANGYAKMTVTGLTAGTTYYYGVEIDGVVDATRGRFRTFPVAGESFEIIFGSCSEATADRKAFDTIRVHNPLFFVHLGDFHYADIASNDEALFRTQYETCMGVARREQMHREVANVYVWDNHDYGNGSLQDGAGASATARPAASAVYRQVVPHHPLPAGAGNNPIYQSFNVGRVRFVLTDLRHARSDNSATDNASKTMLGATQKAWFKAQLDAARDEGDALVVWLNSQVWRVDPPFTGIDTDQGHWGGFSTERAELANYIKDNDIPQVMILGGDAHMVAFDDGAHADYATGGGAPIPEYHASAFLRGGNTRGTDWQSGTQAGDDHFGIVRFEDDGDRLAVSFRAYSVDNTTGAETVICRHQFVTSRYWSRTAMPFKAHA